MENNLIPNTDYPYYINSKLKNENDNHPILHKSQTLVLKYYEKIRLEQFCRGILLMFKMGIGKTLPSVAFGFWSVIIGRKLNCIVLLNAFLKQNYVKEIKLFVRLLLLNYKKIKTYPDKKIFWQFVEELNLTCFNREGLDMELKENIEYSELKNIIDTLDDNKLNNIVDKYFRFYFMNSYGFTEHGMKSFVVNYQFGHKFNQYSIVVDEAHHFFNHIINGAEYAVKAYELIMQSPKTMIMFLTGTPMVSNIFEIKPCLDMLLGADIGFGHSPDDFKSFFFTNDGNLQNEWKLLNRIFGLIFFYEGKEEDLPKTNPLKVQLIPMKNIQRSVYEVIERIEATGGRNNHNLQVNNITKVNNIIKGGGEFLTAADLIAKMTQKSDSSNTKYKTRTRIASNYISLLKTSVDQDIIDRKEENELIVNNKISCKIQHMMKNINNPYFKGVHLIYSNFVEGGTEVAKDFLEFYGYSDYNSRSDSPKYAIMTGDQDLEERNKIRDIISSKNNYDGSLIKVLIVSLVAAEGVNFKNIKFVHIVEPFWNYSLILQVIGRAVRKNSLEYVDEPKEVTSFIYLSAYSENIENRQLLEMDIDEYIEFINKERVKKKINMSIDEFILFVALKKQNYINKFTELLKSSCVNCQLLQEEGFEMNCRECYFDGVKSNVPLFKTYNIINDNLIVDPCNTSKSNESKFKKIVYNGKEYQIVKTNQNLFGVVILGEKMTAYGKVFEELKFGSDEFQTLIKHLKSINMI